MGSPGDAVAAFSDAIVNGDEPAARRVSAGWDAAGDSPSKLFKQGVSGGFRLQALVTVTQPDRAIVGTAIVKGKKAQRVWVMARRAGDDWRVGGVTDSAAYAAFFLDGLVVPPERVQELPDSPSAAAFVTALLDPSSTHADSATVRQGAPGRASVVVARLGRDGVCHLVEVGGDEARGYWVLLNATKDGFVVRGASRFDELAAVLLRADLWPRAGTAQAGAAPAGAVPKGQMLAESAPVKAALAQVFEDAMAQAAAGAGPGGDQTQTEALQRLFRDALAKLEAASAGTGTNPPSDDLSDLASELLSAVEQLTKHTSKREDSPR